MFSICAGHLGSAVFVLLLPHFTVAKRWALSLMQVAWNQVDLGSHMDQESKERLFSGVQPAAEQQQAPAALVRVCRRPCQCQQQSLLSRQLYLMSGSCSRTSSTVAGLS
jgi:hypothetical protein